MAEIGKGRSSRAGKLRSGRAGKRLSPQERIAKVGMVEFRRSAELVDIARTYRIPYGVRMSEPMSWGNVIGLNPAVLGLAIAVDIGEAIVRDVQAICDPEVRAALKEELLRDLRIVRRPWYYARETKRRRQLAAERRKLHRRTTANPCPTAEQLRAAWAVRKASKENMIRLGGMLHDLECYVDNTLRLDENGNVIGRNRGIRGWIADNAPELSPKYKTLMRYKAMAIRLRQATKTQDPLPTDDILKEPRSEVAAEILAAEGETFVSLMRAIDHFVLAENVFRKPPGGWHENGIMRRRSEKK